MKYVSFLVFVGIALFVHRSVLGQASGEALNPDQMTLPKDVKALEDAALGPSTIIQFPNNQLSDFLNLYETLKGVTLIKDATLLQGGPPLSLTTNKPVTKAEAIRLIESTLLLNGYAFIAVDKN